jgi:hypothetical protein
MHASGMWELLKSNASINRFQNLEKYETQNKEKLGRKERIIMIEVMFTPQETSTKRILDQLAAASADNSLINQRRRQFRDFLQQRSITNRQKLKGSKTLHCTRQ